MWPHSSPAHSRPDSGWEEGGECREENGLRGCAGPPMNHKGKDMHRARGLTVLIVAALAAFACAGGSSGGGSKGTITIGVSLPLSGEEASQGTPTKNGVLFYVQQHPTIDGFTLKGSAKDYAVNGSPDATRRSEEPTAELQSP